MSDIQKRYILGIDPGLGGALAWFDPLLGLGITQKMPVIKKSKRTKKRELDLNEIAQQIKTLLKETHFAVIEEVHSMPRQGVVSMFTFGKVYGMVIGILAAHKIPIFYTPPSVWKPLSGLSHRKTDAVLKVKKDFGMEVSHGEAEALLIAVFGKRFLNGSIP